MGIVAIWFMAMIVAWMSNRIRSLREMEAVMQRRLQEKELSQADAGGMAAVEWVSAKEPSGGETATNF